MKQTGAERSKRWRLRHPERAKEIAKRHYRTHGESPKHRASQRRWAETHRAEKAAYNKRWTNANRQRKLRNNARWQKKALKTNPAFRLKVYLRNRVRAAIRNARTKKSADTIALIGCDISFLMGYVEARFKPGMSWKNYGAVWELDHHIPLASFDLSDPSHQRSAFHYSNLRPLFKPENLAKGAKLPAPHQAELL